MREVKKPETAILKEGCKERLADEGLTGDHIGSIFRTMLEFERERKEIWQFKATLLEAEKTSYSIV